MSDLITLALYVLATARLTRLIMDDRITEKFRTWILRRAAKDSLRRYLLRCVWCLSMWMPFGAAYVLVPHHPAALIPAATLAYSWLAVILRDLQRLLNGKANLYNQPMPDPSPEPEQQEAER